MNRAICRNADTGEIVSFTGSFKDADEARKLVNPTFLRVLEIEYDIVEIDDCGVVMSNKLNDNKDISFFKKLEIFFNRFIKG